MQEILRRQACAVLLGGMLCGVLCPTVCRASGGRLTLHVIDKATGQPVACRIHLKNPVGRPYQPRKLPFWNDHFVFDGTVALDLRPGNYTFELERGPEYAVVTGYFTIEDFADDEKTIELVRMVNMAGEGWWSGDLHVHRPARDIELLMKAEDLHVAGVITWWNKQNAWLKNQAPDSTIVKFDGDRFYDLMGGEDEREGGALLFLRMPRPLDMSHARREYPSSMAFLAEARKQDTVWVDVEKPFWWDVPMWLASGQVDSIELANNHMQRDGMLDEEAWGRPRDLKRLPGPWGNGQWTEEIYFHILNCGMRIPPTAGSASGVLANPVGYNRVYAFVGQDLTFEGWFEAVKAGRVIVTNGPLLRTLVAGKLPGHVFRGAEGEELSVDVNAKLGTRDPVRYLEIIRNGQVERSVSLDEWNQGGNLDPLKLTESGWFLVRVVTEVQNTYRFASTGPYYVEIGDTPRRVSRESAQFFLDWMDERIGGIKLDDPEERRDVLSQLEQARRFWQDLVDSANAE